MQVVTHGYEGLKTPRFGGWDLDNLSLSSYHSLAHYYSLAHCIHWFTIIHYFVLLIRFSEGANTMDIGRTILGNFYPRHRLDAGTFGLTLFN